MLLVRSSQGRSASLKGTVARSNGKDHVLKGRHVTLKGKRVIWKGKARQAAHRLPFLC